MPERWERELTRLRQAEMPGGIRVRAEQGPRGEGMPPARQRIAAAVVAFALFIGAGAFSWQALRPTGGHTPGEDVSEPVLTEARVSFAASGAVHPEDRSVDLPSAELTVNGTTVQGQWDNFEWRGAIFNMATPSFVDPVSLPLGSRVVIAGDADAVAGLFADPDTRDPVEDLRLSDQGGYLMARPGEYFLMFEAKWHPDVVPFYFPIEVQPVEPDLTDADAELSITAYPFEAVLSFGGQRISIPEVSGTRSDGKATATERASAEPSGEVPGWARISIPVGTPLELSGNWEDWSNRFEPGDGRVTANDQGSLVFPPSEGTYRWEMTASWPQGEAEFLFGLDLLDSEGPVTRTQSPSPVSGDPLGPVSIEIHGVRVATGAPTAVARFDGQRVDGCPQWFEWRQLDGTVETGGGNLACDEIQGDETLLVADTALELSGDFEDAQIHFGWPDTGQLEVNQVPRQAVGRGRSKMVIEGAVARRTGDVRVLGGGCGR